MEMEYRRLGKSGLHISALSFGSWVTFSAQVHDDSAIEMMKLAYDAGVNFFDNAEVYADGESEIIMGRALKKLAWARDTYCVSSKVFWGGEKPTQMGLSRKHVFDACHAALNRLQVDYLDLYFCHRPDLHTPVLETVWAMNDLIRQGKILYWGTSEWTAQQITEAHACAREYRLIGPTMEQPEYNLFNREKVEKDFLPLYENQGLGTTIWSPLASGILSGKYDHGIPDGSRLSLPGYEWLKKRYETLDGKLRIEKAAKLGKIAKSLDLTTAQLSIAWCLKNKNVSTVILGASKIAQLKENLDVMKHLPKVTDSVVSEIEAIVQTKPEPAQDYKR